MTMIEKAARATFAKWRAHMDSEGHKSGPRTWDEMKIREQEFAMLAARAAIEAVKEPTEEMVEAGIYAATLERDHLAEEGVPEIYRAMLFAALAREPSPR